MADRRAYRTAAQTASLLGLTVKTLRVWERAGLLRPGRTPAGWRAYGPDEFARIHQIVALRGLGLKLADVADLLAGGSAELTAALAMQAEILTRRKAEADKGLSAVRAAQARLKSGAGLSLDELSQLIREMTMTQPLSLDDLRDALAPTWNRHFTPEQLAALKARLPIPEGRAALAQQWRALFEEAQAVMRRGDPTSVQARDLARRWSAALRAFEAVADPEVMAKAKVMWADAVKDTANSRGLMVTTEVRAFMAQAIEAMKAAEGPAS